MLRHLVCTLTVALGVPLLVACDLAPRDGDEAYVEGWCNATNDFSDALVTAGDAEAIEGAIAQYRNALDELEPEDDVAAFHDAFLSYIDGVAADPVELTEGDPPEPPSDVRLRLESLARGVDACNQTDLFGR